MKVCACGCGELIPDINKKGLPATYKSVGHYWRGRKRPYKIRVNAMGSTHCKWKGGRILGTRGYMDIWKPEHHFASSRGYVREHRLVFEEFHNCMLLPWADIHHKDGNKLNNDINNLEPLMHDKHTSITNIGNKYNLGRKLSEEHKQNLREYHNPNSNLVGRRRKE